MKIFLILLSCIILFPTASAASGYRVLGGEHEGFTRIVIYVPKDSAWEVISNSSQAEVTFPNQDFSFDTRDVYKRISKTRISSISPSGQGLLLKLSCTCLTKAYEDNTGLLVIDVVDHEHSGKFPSVKIKQVFPTYNALKFSLQRGTSHKEHPVPTDKAVGRRDDTELGEKNEGLAGIFPPPFRRNDIDYLKLHEENIASDLGFAMTRGILSPNFLSNSQLNVLSLEDLESRQDVNLSKNLFTEQLESQLENNESSSLNVTSNFHYHECPDLQSVNISAWSVTNQPISDFGDMQRGIYDVDGSINNQGLIAYTRSLLYFGFADEAKLAINLTSTRDRELDILNYIADILAGNYSQDSHKFKNWADCDSAAAMWAFLDPSKILETQNLNSEVVLRELSLLPIHLRMDVSSYSSRTFMELGDSDSADHVRELSHRLASADLIEEHDEKFNSRNINEGIGGPNLSAAISLMEEIISEASMKNSIPLDQEELMGAYVHELRDSVYFHDLHFAHILSLIYSDQFVLSQSSIKDLEDSLSFKEVDDLIEKYYERLVENDSDIDFLENIFNSGNFARRVDSNRVLSSIFRRADELGFTHQGNMVFSERANLQDRKSREFGIKDDKKRVSAEVSKRTFEPNARVPVYENKITPSNDTISLERLNEEILKTEDFRYKLSEFISSD